MISILHLLLLRFLFVNIIYARKYLYIFSKKVHYLKEKSKWQFSFLCKIYTSITFFLRITICYKTTARHYTTSILQKVHFCHKNAM